ncbi:hypothetical protein BDF14DRAFT_1800754 [Spinellus fusiger]|nr:hypothetical protein BDF14DRAFT_1800754 [Spinellus fusiger]
MSGCNGLILSPSTAQSLKMALQVEKPISDKSQSNSKDNILDPCAIGEEYRESSLSRDSSVWYFDEFTGCYRHKALHHRTSPLPSASMKLQDTSPTSQTTGFSSSFDQAQLNLHAWPIPTTKKQVYMLCEQANASGNYQTMLSLCHHLIDCAHKCTRSTESTEKKESSLNNFMLLESQRILKKLAMVGQSRGKTGYCEAQFLLANCFGMGALGIGINHENAFLWYIQASKQNHAEATYRAAVCYELGIGTRRDEGRAIIFFRKAATMSHVPSMYKLGIILLYGYCGQPQNSREAMAWLQRAAANASPECPHALYTLAMVQLSDDCNETNIIADSNYAIELLLKAGKLGHITSQLKLGELYEYGKVVKEDSEQSIYWYSMAAQNGNIDASLALSGWYLTGSPDVLDQSDREAYLWVRKAAGIKNVDRWSMAKAHYVVGIYIEHGIGVERSIEGAKKWFSRATRLGHKKAAKRLELLSDLTHTEDSKVVDKSTDKITSQ